MWKKGLGVLLLAAAVLMTLGIGADFSDYKAQRSIHVKVVADDQEFIDLTPIQPYAYINNDGVLVLDFSDNNPNYPGQGGTGISPNSNYNFDDVFGVSNHLWSNDSEYGYIIVTINSSNPDVELYCKIVQGENKCYAVSLESGELAEDSDSAAQQIQFCLEENSTKKIGMHLAGGSSMGWLNGTLTITAVPDTEDVCPVNGC